MPPPTLPTELVEYILDFLDSLRDRQTLSCSLVSRSWVQSSQSQLFREIRLRLSRQTRLSNEQIVSPHLVLYIRRLEILSHIRSRLNSNPLVAQLLPMLSALCSLKLYNVNWGGSGGLSEDVQQAFRALLARPTLTSVHLDHCNSYRPLLPFYVLLSTVPSLKRLSLSQTRLDHENDVASDYPPPRKPVTLDYLSLERFVESLISSRISQFIDFTRLRTLVSHDDVCHVYIIPLLPVLGRAGTLERLELDSVPQSPEFDLSLVPSLRHLSLKYVNAEEGGRLVGFLSNVSALAQLEDVHIVIGAEILVIPDNRSPSIDWTAWGELDELFAAPPLIRLRRVTFDVDVSECWDLDLYYGVDTSLGPNEVARFEAMFSKLRQRGVLRVNEVNLTLSDCI
ncbi:hypothetical protein MVEN_01496200 [Mycena venus]|uniref:F-box domain-containing protein n=1 Tax=Mycena venus TaxID=2733690 RepID=A0A8H6XSR4_9AGAR|nr:hypothetical protein MVEN_01496200 [Mycena venus]